MKKWISFLIIMLMVLSCISCTLNREQKEIENQILYIEELGELKEKGLITEKEFQQKKLEILGLKE